MWIATTTTSNKDLFIGIARTWEKLNLNVRPRVNVHQSRDVMAVPSARYIAEAGAVPGCSHASTSLLLIAVS